MLLSTRCPGVATYAQFCKLNCHSTTRYAYTSARLLGVNAGRADEHGVSPNETIASTGLNAGLPSMVCYHVGFCFLPLGMFLEGLQGRLHKPDEGI